MNNRYYIAIDLKSFYASVECVMRNLDPLTTNLVVADSSRSEKTICLAVTPSLKAYGIPGRARLFEVVSRVKEINQLRLKQLGVSEFNGISVDSKTLNEHTDYEVDFIAAPPRMQLYMDNSSRIYNIYLRYIAPEDIHVYSVDEVFMDVTDYLQTYNMTPSELARTMVEAVYNETGITATAGIGTNLYLCKIAMDIVAKHMPADTNGVRIAELDEMKYREELWNHTPLTDFWRVGRGYAKKLKEYGMFTMGDVAKCSLGKDNDYLNSALLYKLFGVNAELLIDHAWGYEPCKISDIKAYKPESNSLGSGQVLKEPYNFEKGRLIMHEMTDLLVLDLVDKGMVTDQIVMTVCYDIDNLKNGYLKSKYQGEITKDTYGRKVPKPAHGSYNLEQFTSSSKTIIDAALNLYDSIVNKDLLVRKLYVTANHIIKDELKHNNSKYEQIDIFSYMDSLENKDCNETEEKEKNMQQAILSIKKKYGKNAILKGMNLYDGATTVERNSQIGGHKS